MPDKILRRPSLSVLQGCSLSLAWRISVDVFTRAGGQNVRCFGGKTLRGLRNSITRILRREISQHVLFTALELNCVGFPSWWCDESACRSPCVRDSVTSEPQHIASENRLFMRLASLTRNRFYDRRYWSAWYTVMAVYNVVLYNVSSIVSCWNRSMWRDCWLKLISHHLFDFKKK